MSNDPKVIVALDYPSKDQALALVDKLTPEQCRLKVGKELFTRSGPELVENLVARNFDVFLDLKFHDIPNTVANACIAAAELGVWMMNVHAQGGSRMMSAAMAALKERENRPLLIAVTVLTSMGQSDLDELGMTGSPQERVLKLASLADQSGLDGVVCSPLETTAIRKDLGDDFCLVTPGIRPKGVDVGDQKRITTPADALANGSDYLVIGRPITAADDPVAALEAIRKQISEYYRIIGSAT